MLTKENIDNIIDTWNERAEDDNIKYYHKEHWESEISDGKKCFVIGRKGSGKTALCAHLNKEIKRSITITFDYFSTNLLRELSQINDSPGQAAVGKTLWRLLIYSQVCLMIKNHQDTHAVYEDENVRAILNDLYPQLVYKRSVSISSFNVQVLGSGIGIGFRNNKHKISVDQALAKLENYLLGFFKDNHRAENTYYVLFDRLDAEFNFKENDSERKTYFSLLSDLFDTILTVKRLFCLDNYLRIRCVAFLRDDLYAEIRNPLKATWNNELIRIGWHADRLKELLAHRLGVVLGITNSSFDEIWAKIVQISPSKNPDSLFKKIIFQTQLRPRDLILYIKLIAEKISAEHSGNDSYQALISEKTVNSVSRDFSFRLRDHIFDEYLPHFDKLIEVFSLLDGCKAIVFKYKDAEKVFQLFCSQNGMMTYQLLGMLYQFNIIGIKTANTKHGIRYKYSNDSAFYFSDDVEYCIHEGLVKAVFQKGIM